MTTLMPSMAKTLLGISEVVMYLDNAATTKPCEGIIDILHSYLAEDWYNPSANYKESWLIHNKIEQVKTNIAKDINASKKEIYFTSGGSESNCWAIQGFVHACCKKGLEPVVITTKIEHKSILECVTDYCNNTLRIQTHFLDVNINGVVNLNQLKQTLKDLSHTDKKILVSVQMANNELGVIQPISQISKIVHEYGGYIHTDSVQVFNYLNIDVESLGIDMLSASAHKFHGLKGTGFLYIRRGLDISPIIYGSQNDGKRGGTENVVGIAAMGEALCMRKKNIEKLWKLRDEFLSALAQILSPYNYVINVQDNRKVLPTIISLTIKENVTAESIMYLLNKADIQVSAGSACNSQSKKPSYVLQAIGMSDWDIVRTIRISFNEELTTKDINEFVCELKKAIATLV